MQLNGLDLWLWLAGLLEHVAILVVLWRYQRVKDFPLFSVWISANVFRTIVLFLVYSFGGPYAYYYTYLSFAIVDISLQVAVAFEIALHVFRPAGKWSTGAKQSFATVFTVAVLFSAALGWLAQPATRYLSDTLLLRGNFFSAALLSELFVGMLILTAKLGLPWRTHVARLAEGLGTFSLMCILAEALQTYCGLNSGSPAFREISRSKVVLSQLIAVYWIVTLMRDAPAEREMPEQMRASLRALQKQATLLANLLREGGRA